MRRLLLALAVASALALGLAACVSVPLDAPDIQSRAASGSVTSVNVTASSITVSNALRVTNTLTLSGTQMSGPVRYGLASGAVVSGTQITHGIGTTPTVVLLTASLPITTPLFVSTRGATTFTVGISDSVSTSGVYWLAGR